MQKTSLKMQIEIFILDQSTATTADDWGDLSPDEVLRANKYHFEEDQKKFVRRRSALRQILAKRLGKHPRSISFEYSKLGKPQLAREFSGKLYFNVSHSRDFAIIGIGMSGQIGVDIEYLDSDVDSDLISKRFFATPEISEIMSSETRHKTDAFFRHWTIKEAFIKAIGKGLTFPLNEVIVQSSEGRHSLHFHDPEFDTSEWSVLLDHSLDNYLIAAVARQTNSSFLVTKVDI